MNVPTDDQNQADEGHGGRKRPRKWPDVDEIPEYGELVNEPEDAAGQDRAATSRDREEGASDA